MPKKMIKTPNSKIGRLVLGWALVIGGILGFLPVLGFWMIPLGVIVLSVDSPFMRRLRRKAEVWIGRKREEWKQRKDKKKARDD